MKLKINVADLNKPNLNGIIYTEDAIKNACKRINNNDIPIVFIGDDDFEFQAMYAQPCGNLIGSAQLKQLDYPNIEFEAFITNEIFKNSIREGRGGFGPNYLATIEPTDNDVQVVSDAKISTIGYTLNPASKTSFEVINDDN